MFALEEDKEDKEQRITQHTMSSSPQGVKPRFPRAGTGWQIARSC